MKESCELCGFEALEPAYGADLADAPTVYLCAHCGLGQSHGGANAKKSSASFGTPGENAKNIRVKSTLGLLREHADFSHPLSVLDVGAARGSFVRGLLSAAPGAFMIAVEPNEGQAWACAFRNRSKIISRPVEETHLPDEEFDVVHSCRTLEHLHSPLATLQDHWRVLKPGGLLILDCRNIGAIREESIVDEWFAPNFRFHFSTVTLCRMLSAAGFEILEPPNYDDKENILVAAVKSERKENDVAADPLEVHSARALIAFYKFARQRNLSALNAIATELKALIPHDVAICGSGRLLNSLLRHSDLDQENFQFFSEVQLGLKSSQQHNSAEEEGLQLKDPNPGIIVVMSDTQNDEIARMASRMAPQAEIIHYTQLVFRAYNRRAA